MQQASGAIARPPTTTSSGLSFAIVALIATAASWVFFASTLRALVGVWDTQPEYSYGFLIPFVFLFLLYQRLGTLAEHELRGSWIGFALVLAGIALGALGRVSTMDTVAQYGFLLSVWGLALSYLGWRVARIILVPLVILAFMLPIPNYLLRETSAVLQLVSSKLGVQFIRWCGISVYLEGNVIDLGTMKLQVVEACSGLRYMFSLLVLSFLVAYFYQDRMWKRVLVFLSAIPITVFMNSLRIAVVGVTVDLWGPEMAEGVLHDFEGITIFLGCVLLLLLEIWLLTRASGGKRLHEVLAIDIPRHDWQRVRKLMQPPAVACWASAALLALAALGTVALPERVHATPERAAFTAFPAEIGSWRGYPGRLEPEVLTALKLDDYLLVDYFDAGRHSVNLYASYYDRQTDGNSAHSPRACIPGDGWEIRAFDSVAVAQAGTASGPLRANRVVIQKGEHRALVYYWFQQRGRIVTDEYMVKLYIFVDSLLQGRTDGAMVRLVTPLDKDEKIEVAEARLQAFAAQAMPHLRRFVPE